MWAFDKPLVWIIILLIVVILFGASKIPEIGKGLGQGIRSFKEETRAAMDDKPSNPVDLESKPGATTIHTATTNGTTETVVRRRIIKHPDGREEVIEEPVAK